jgi:TPR repeat protein
MTEWVDIFQNGVGVGVAADPAKDRDVLARALSAEFKTEHHNFGYCPEHGNGERPDFEKAKRYCKIAAQNGNACSRFNLTLLHGNRTGVLNDMVESARSQRWGG